MDAHIIETREFTWILHNFTQELVKVDKYINSEDFSIFLGTEETEWYFCVKLHETKCGLYLHLVNSETDDFTVKFEGFVRNVSNQKSFINHLLRTSNEFNAGNGWGWTDCFPVNKICKDSPLYLKDTTLTLGLKVVLTKKNEPKPETRKCDSQYIKMCKEYFDSKSLSDITIICSDGIKIQAHKFILAGFSSVMKEIIDSKLTDSKSNKVKISDIDGETMTEILRFIYTTEINNVKELAIKLLHGAEKYELTKLKKLCVASMIENLSVDNVMEYFILADKYNSNVLLFRSAVFIKQNYYMLQSKDLKKIPKKLLLTLLDYYQHIPGEITVFKSML